MRATFYFPLCQFVTILAVTTCSAVMVVVVAFWDSTFQSQRAIFRLVVSSGLRTGLMLKLGEVVCSDAPKRVVGCVAPD